MHQIKISILIIILSIFTGCSTSAKYAVVEENYQQINFNDGIALEEAKHIAQNELISKYINNEYLIFEPKVIKKLKSVPHSEDYWFVTFDESEPEHILVVYLVALSKSNGEIVYSKRYFPGKEWILQAFFLQLMSP